MLLDAHVLCCQNGSFDDGVRCHRNRGGADDSDLHIQVPGLCIGAAQLDGCPILHVMLRSESGPHRQAAMLELQIGLDGTD